MFHVKVIEADGSAYANEIIQVDDTDYRTNGSGVAEIPLSDGEYTFTIPNKVTRTEEVTEGQILEISLD